MSAPWWKRLPDRLLEEEQALLSLRGGEVPMVRTHRWAREPDGEPRIRVTLPLGAESFELEVRFPWHYPDGCPSVRPIPYDRPVSSHQFVRSGIFCLELGPDNWHPHYTAADMVRSAWRLLMQEAIASVEPFEIQSRHVSNLAEQVALAAGVLVRTAAFDDCVRHAESATEFEVAWPLRNFTRVFPVSFPKGTRLPDAVLTLDREQRLPALLVPLTSSASEQVPKELPEFDEFVSKFGGTPLADGAPLVIMLKWTTGTARGYLRLPQGVLHLIDLPLTSTGPRSPEALINVLPTIKVGIVGLGSLGSKIAVSLARTGVRRFVLVDGDVFMGENVCRHAGTFPDVGAMKVDVVKELLRDVSPAEPEVVRYSVDVASATNPDLHARIIEDLGGADIVIDATANPEVFGLLAMIASDKQRAMVWGEVFGGGVGGLVASAHPAHDPCPRCVRAGFAASTRAWPPAPGGIAKAAYDGGDGAPFTATDADVTFIAAAMTNRVLDIASDRYQGLPAVMLLGFRSGWIFDASFQSVPIRVRSDDWSCSRCWTPAFAPDAETAARAEALFSPTDHAHDPSAT